MWMGLFAGWLLGSATLYAYMIATAREPKEDECMDCRLCDCAGCPYLDASKEVTQLKRAA